MTVPNVKKGDPERAPQRKGQKTGGGGWGGGGWGGGGWVM